MIMELCSGSSYTRRVEAEEGLARGQDQGLVGQILEEEKTFVSYLILSYLMLSFLIKVSEPKEAQRLSIQV